MTADEIIQYGIYNWFKADQTTNSIYAALLNPNDPTDLVPSFYFGAAEQNAVFPYCICTIISNPPEANDLPQYALNGGKFEHRRVQFSLFTDDRSDTLPVVRLKDKLRTRFDRAAISFSSTYTIVVMMPAGGTGPMFVNEQGDVKCMATQDYLLSASA